MSKGISTKMLITVAMAAVALFAATQVMADDPCTNFTFTLESVTPKGNGSHTFTYNVSPGNLPINKISHVEFGISSSLEVDQTPSKIKVFDHTEGGIGNFDYALGVPQVQVVSIEAQVENGYAPVSFDVWGTGGKSGPVGIHTDAGNKQETCVDEGPIPFDSLDPVPEVLTFTREAEGYTCLITITLEPSFEIEAHDPLEPGNDEKCKETQETPIENLAIGGEGGTAIELQEGWFAYHGSPAEYCYYNKKKRKYVCVEY